MDEWFCGVFWQLIVTATLRRTSCATYSQSSVNHRHSAAFQIFLHFSASPTCQTSLINTNCTIQSLRCFHKLEVSAAARSLFNFSWTSYIYCLVLDEQYVLNLINGHFSDHFEICDLVSLSLRFGTCIALATTAQIWKPVMWRKR